MWLYVLAAAWLIVVEALAGLFFMVGASDPAAFQPLLASAGLLCAYGVGFPALWLVMARA